MNLLKKNKDHLEKYFSWYLPKPFLFNQIQSFCQDKRPKALEKLVLYKGQRNLAFVVAICTENIFVTPICIALFKTL